MTPATRPSPSPASSLGSLELRCPPLPHTLVEALNLVDNPAQINTKTVTSLLERDPLVIARLLQTVNSAYYGLPRTISSPERAVVMLGPVAVVGIIVGMSMLRLRSVLEGPASDCFSRLILHSIATAYLADSLTKDQSPCVTPPAGRTRTGSGYTAGLLHDFGKIILVYNFPDKAVALYDEGSLSVRAESACEMESLLFGSDHTEAGAFAARKLRFPDPLAHVARHHHAPEQADPEAAPLVRAVAVANLAAGAMGYGFTEARSWEACTADPVWALYAEHAPPCTPEALTDLLAAKQTDLDEYVRSFTMPTP